MAAALTATLAATVLSGCGGGNGTTPAVDTSSIAAAVVDGRSMALAADGRSINDLPANVLEAKRFLTQATFGPDDDNLILLQRIGYSAWIDRQFAMTPSKFRSRWEEVDAEMRALNPAAGADVSNLVDVFWERALNGPDQLRQRVAYALSQIFVLSSADGEVQIQPRALAAWLDMLNTDGLTTYRQLLENVARHPLMGRYLTHLRNQKEDTGTGRVPDENFAREVMQLFSIGVAQLYVDGSQVLENGQPVETYTPADVSGLARVFTGWSFACPGYPSASCFNYGVTGGANSQEDPDREFKPMLAYPAFHTLESKSFLGVTVPQGVRADPYGGLKVALDTLAAHPNVGPFIGKQLIQRLTSSNPSKAYVAAIAAVWANNGAGVRGDIKAVVKAILTHPEAKQPGRSTGKIREPVLRLSAFLRAFPHSSDTGYHRVGVTDDPSKQLGQTPLRAPSVFNFYRPGYVLPNSQSAAVGLVAPEAQLVSESSISGWVNFMVDNLYNGIGVYNTTLGSLNYNRRDLQRSWRDEMALSDNPRGLVDAVVDKLLYGQAAAALRTQVTDAVTAIGVPPLTDDGSNVAEVEAAQRDRVYTAVVLTLASTEFLVQK